MKYNKIAIIPARSGSKGLKDKNIIDICGKPLIAYSILAAKESALFSEIIVSTDSRKYAAIAEKYGAEIIMREENLSKDNTPTYEVIEDILHKRNESPDYFMLLQPTSPMRKTAHILEAACLFESRIEHFDFLVSVKEAEHVGALVKPIGDDNTLKYFNEDFCNYTRQSFKEYSPNGAIFIGKPDKYIKKKHFFGERSIAYKMNDIDSIDIDNELDYEVACLCMRKRLNREKEEKKYEI